MLLSLMMMMMTQFRCQQKPRLTALQTKPPVPRSLILDHSTCMATCQVHNSNATTPEYRAAIYDGPKE
ncbi:hypothetical protein CSKR_112858 [Clonorchis sinensis]|uniref:Uncharacterized protein n=1 Tax=Clonorchis sinensis TaxID=79923 RepID=A0A419PNG2_CLOSI|nr:hypothetical protein CSKR_112858 [Clonorchis sinensis]